MNTIVNNVAELIGSTPLVRIHHLGEDLPATGGARPEILAKLESANPAGSVKDRVALAIIRAAEASGELKPGGTIVEATSGNTGIGLAAVGAALGYHVVITMPSTMSAERRALMRAYGAELILTTEGGVQGAVDAAAEILRTREGAVLASQFTNPANPHTHYASTAEEIWQATGGRIDAFVAGIGTGGTITGVGRRLRELNPAIRIVGIEPAESPLLTQGTAAPHGIQGIGANFVPEVLDRSLIDEILTVSTADAIATARAAARREGLLVGISSGAALAGALAVGHKFTDDDAARDHTPVIVTLLPDTGERYLSTALFDQEKK